MAARSLRIGESSQYTFAAERSFDISAGLIPGDGIGREVIPISLMIQIVRTYSDFASGWQEGIRGSTSISWIQLLFC